MRVDDAIDHLVSSGLTQVKAGWQVRPGTPIVIAREEKASEVIYFRIVCTGAVHQPIITAGLES